MDSEKTDRLQAIFRVVFELPTPADVTRVHQKIQENWDSLGHVKLVAALESEFNISLDTADALRIDSFESARLLLEERGV